MTTFERINKLSKKRGLSLRAVAKKSGLGETTIYGWKNKNPDSSKLEAVASTLGVSVDYLLGKDSSSAKPKIDLADDDSFIAFYEGKPVSDDDMEIIKRLLRGK